MEVFFKSRANLHAISTISSIIKLPRSYKMAHQQSVLSNFLTIILLLIVYIAQIVIADLEPQEEEVDDVKPPTDLKVKPDEMMTTLEPPKTNLGFIHAFIASFSVIIVSEIGDKTFFIAAIMSMV